MSPPRAPQSCAACSWLKLEVATVFLLDRVAALASLAMPPAMCAQPAPRDPYTKLSAEEIRLAKLRYDEDDMQPSKIAELLRRDKSTMTRLLVKQEVRMKEGRPKTLHDAAVDKLVSLFSQTTTSQHASVTQAQPTAMFMHMHA